MAKRKNIPGQGASSGHRGGSNMGGLARLIGALFNRGGRGGGRGRGGYRGGAGRGASAGNIAK